MGLLGGIAGTVSGVAGWAVKAAVPVGAHPVPGQNAALGSRCCWKCRQDCFAVSRASCSVFFDTKYPCGCARRLHSAG